MSKFGIVDFISFVEFFSKYDTSSCEMKELYKILGNNSLMRYRIYTLRMTFSSSESIKDFLKKHEDRIRWQLERIYRVRNIVTHIGISFYGIESCVECVHNYFDYVLNYVLCKIENDEYITNIKSIIFEVKNDNDIYYKYLKDVHKLKFENYKVLLFGPDERLINYIFPN